MRKFIYEEPHYNGTIQRTLVTEQWIIDHYLPDWERKIRDKELITLENCIDDFCTVHGAWEL